MSDDLLSLLSGGKDSLAPKVDPNADAAIRTIYGEADGEPDAGKLAVAAVIRNRAAKTGKSLAEVVADPGAFEAWTDPKRRSKMEALTPDTEQYQALLQLVAPALSGDVDPTNGADHYYAPKLQADLGRPAPAWATGEGLPIGNHVFFKVGDQPTADGPDELLGILGAGEGAHPPVQESPLPPAAPNPANPPLYPNKGGQQGAGANLVAGLGQGVNDVGATLLEGMSHLSPPQYAAGNKLLVQQAVDQRNAFDKDYAGSANAIGGRLAGNLVATAPFMALGGEAVAPALEAAGPVGTFLSGAYKGNKLLQLGSRAAAGAGQGGALSALTSSASDEPLLNQVGRGGATGAVLGAGIPAAADGVRLVRNKLFPTETVSPAVADLAKTAIEKYKIPIRTSQIKGVGDRNAAIADSERLSQPATGYPENNAEQTRAFTTAITKTFGEDADRMTPDVMQRAKTRIGGVMDGVAKRTTIADTGGLKNDLNGVIYNASQVLRADELQPLQKQIEAIESTFQPDGSLSGESYQALTRKGSPLDDAANGPPGNIRDYAQKIRNVLDDALEASASPEDAKALTQARWQYKNLMTVKNLAAKANVEGEISPRLLNGAVNTSFKNRAFQGAGDLGELAQIGQTFLKEPPNSGTTPRLMERLSRVLPALAGGGAVGDLALAFHDPSLALKLAGAGVAAAGVRGAAGGVNNALIRHANLSPGAVNKLLQASMGPSGSVVVRPANRVLAAFNDNVALPAGVVTANRLLSPRPTVGR